MSKITLLIAIYNAEQTLARALDSLLQQTHTDWQAVCIDDASTDQSADIIRNYAARDQRFTPIFLHKNSGHAHARNVGLRVATGDIITFLDSDDWLSDDALESLDTTFRNHPLTDCVLFRMVSVENGKETEYKMPVFTMLSGREAFDMSLNWTIHGVYAARRTLYERFPYDETCHVYSDELTTHLHYYIAREVRACAGTYYYWQNPVSVTHKASVHRFDFIRAKERMRECLLGLGVDKEVLNRYEELRWRALIDCYMFYHIHGRELTAEERAQGRQVMRHAWQTIDTSVVPAALTRKFGYRRMPTWRLFRLQEWLYFTLRDLLGRNK